MAARSVRFHPEAIAEAQAAYEWYVERNPPAANAFVSELDHAIDQIQKNPESWPAHSHGMRRFLFRRFPYGVIYRIIESSVQVIAVAHGPAAPGIGNRDGSREFIRRSDQNPTLAFFRLII